MSQKPAETKLNRPKIVAIIPARGGSKRLPRKNIIPVLGKALIHYTIEAAQQCPLIDKIIVSTEDRVISKVASAYNVEVIDRPQELAGDDIRNDQVMLSILKGMSKANQNYDLVFLLQPTSPLRTSRHINECLEKFLQGEWRSAMSVTEIDTHPAKAVILREDKVIPYINKEVMEEQTQKLEKVFQQNGAIYLTYINDFIKSGRLYQEPCMPYLMPKAISIDVDTELDLKYAELLLEKQGDEGK